MARTNPKTKVMPIAWHQENVKNWTRTLEEKRETIRRLQAELDYAEREASFYAQQIAAAIGRGLEGFDRDRFLKPRK